IWRLGFGIGAALLVAGLARLTWLTRAASRASGHWTALAEEISKSYRLRRRVRVLQTRQPALLVTWGSIRPTVLLPFGAEGWSDERIRVVLTHELAHIRRHDWVVQILAELVRCTYWFNPLMWWVCSRLRQEGERACDD